MNSKTTKRKQIITTIMALLTLSTISACTTTQKRDERLLENLEKQNAVIDATLSERTSEEIKVEIDKSETLKEAEVHLQNALGAVKASNSTVINKMKPNDNKECANGETEGDGDEQ